MWSKRRRPIIAKDYRRLWKEITSTSDEGKAVRTLAEVLLDEEGRKFVLDLERKDAELCIEILYHGIVEQNLKATEKRDFFVTLRRLAGTHGVLPGSMMITEEIEVSDKIFASGGFADVRTGTYMGHLVAVKSMKIAEQDKLPKIRRQFCKEVVFWKTLSHPNVLKLVGVWGNMDKGRFITVSEWMEHGNIMDYIRKNSVNRLELLHGAAQGLKYLHGARLIHGDIKGANILMSNNDPPRACLADFGFMTMVLDPSQPMSCSAQLEGSTMMFMSPELLVPKRFGCTESVPTPEADIYAFGLVIYQVLTGDIPFPKLRVAEVTINVVQGVRPSKPENASAIGFSDPLWRLVQRCWDGSLEFRPKVTRVVSQLERAAADWVGVMPPCAQIESVASVSPEPASDPMAHCGTFQSYSCVVPGSPTEPQILSPSLGPPSTSSTQCTEPPSGVPQEVFMKPPNGPPVRKPQQKELSDDLPVVYAHLQQQCRPPSSQLPKRKWTDFIEHLGWRVRDLLRPAPAERPDSIPSFRDGNMALRPKVAKVTTQLERVAVEWDGVMSSCAQADDVASSPGDPVSDAIKRYGILQSSPLFSQPESKATSRLSSHPSRQSTDSGWTEDVTPIAQEEGSNLMQQYRWSSQSIGRLPQSDPPTQWEDVTARGLFRTEALRVLDEPTFQHPNQIASSPSEKQFRDWASSLQDEGVARLVDDLDKILSTHPVSSNFVRYLHRLGWVCGTRGILPKFSMISDSTLLSTSDQPFASGVLTDMYEGSFNGSKVCVEKMRMYLNGDCQKSGKMFFKEAAMWKHLVHPNIVRFRGAILGPPQLVSDWIPNGGLTEYVTVHPEKNRLELLYDVAQGLDYLHKHDIAHGDIKGSNILVDTAGRAYIAGLDLIVATSDLESTAYMTEEPAPRLAAPEILSGNTDISKAADIFSFAMLTIEVFSGAAPFNRSPPTTVAVQIIEGIRPERPAHLSLTDELWEFIQRCWNQEPLRRPGISEVVDQLRNALTAQDSHAGRTDVSTTCETILNSKTSLQNQSASDKFPGVRSSASGDTLRNGGSVEWGKALHKRNTPSGSRGLLQRAAFWLPNHGVCARHNHHGCHDSIGEKRGTTEYAMTLLHLTATTTSGDAPKSSKVFQTSTHRESCSLTCLPLRRFSKRTDQ